MAVALDCLGIAPVGDGLIPADSTYEKGAAAERAGRLTVTLAEQGPTARAFLDRRALLNAMAGIAATGGSTNGTAPPARDLARGGRAARPRRADRRGRAHAGDRKPRPLRPLGRGGPPPRGRHGGGDRRADSRRPPRRRRARTVDGVTLAEATSDASAPDGEIVFPADRPFKPAGRLASLRGNLAPEGSVVKLAGTERTAPDRAGARVRHARRTAPTPCARAPCARARCW